MHFSPSTPRFDRLDALRGAALLWMAAFHFCFDLAHARVVAWNFYADPFWLHQRTAILSLFLLCAGAGQAIATWQGQSWPRFWKRWAQVAACAALVSAGSALMFPNSWIYFGVLHGMAVMLILARLLALAWMKRGQRNADLLVLLGLGTVCLALPHGVQHPWFDLRWPSVLGLVTRKPITEDYVPLLPWFGVMCTGLAATAWVLKHRTGWLASRFQAGASVSASGSAPAPWRLLTLLGQWSLTFYMLHQPVMIGLLEGALMIWRKTP
ncbi:DUF1624 domain-containing protein [Aquabacterium lacunae]|uniref:DUF1624 domain-containing protein n=1 Tax=Aquabacterium lacunae TaxID=2528630 RepID=A0A4Q9GVX6_9BURK|nr:heparan-alpha-glucosaminide N-acetyltransferase [Aquabacterium lacunae]TBO28847.1 DUF1624 domain-containing protein [Aquabacterium lacunae]